MIGIVFGSLITALSRNPSLQQQLFTYTILGNNYEPINLQYAGKSLRLIHLNGNSFKYWTICKLHPEFLPPCPNDKIMVVRFGRSNSLESLNQIFGMMREQLL